VAWRADGDKLTSAAPAAGWRGWCLPPGGVGGARRRAALVVLAAGRHCAYAVKMAVYFHEEDLPEGVLAPGPIAVDTETMGLITARDRLCVVQISDGRATSTSSASNPAARMARPT
jgi:hypothetical protein